jgi:hypothetical protein
MKLRCDLWFRAAKWIGIGLTVTALAWIAFAESVGTTTVHGTVYQANGSPGSGSLQLSWPAFTTAGNQAVAAGRTTVTIGQDGVINVNLAPNLGSTPAGLYYTAVYHMADGTTSTEYWVVPPGGLVNIAQIRAQVMPAAQAVQAVSKAYVDQAIQSINQGSLTSTGGQLTGPLYLNGDPTLALQAADKHYVDATFAQAAPLTGATMTGPLTLENGADAEIDYSLEPGLTTSQKGAFTYKDWNGASQWSMVKDASNNWALNSAKSGLDSFKAYQASNGGDTYVNASNPSGLVRVNYENGSGSGFNVYGGNSSNLYASFSGASSIRFPGLGTTAGRNCLQIDASGSMSNTGLPCSTASGTVGNGNSGQIAYYTNNGTAIGGTDAVPISAGGTGASTAAGALIALAAASLATQQAQSFAGPINAPSVIASVNSQINVMAAPYNAKGDCVTDDNAALTAAQAASDAMGGTLTLYFPQPPGGCYLTSTFDYHGVPLLGQPGGPEGATVTLKGMPGQDVVHVKDPTTNHLTWHQSWAIENLRFLVDNSAAGNFPHRWPGRWFDDGAMTSGSAVFKSGNAGIACGDIGQAIQVNGAGPGGSNLVTTIANVSPCGSFAGVWQTITLAATASTTVSNAHSYISLLNLSVTTNIGNCGLAWDDMDGKQANWVHGGAVYNLYDNLHNVTFKTTNGGINNACGIFTQGIWGFYGIDVQNFEFRGQVFGVVQAPSELNSWYQSTSGDYEKWNHGSMESLVYPWIQYNGGEFQMSGVELTAAYGPQFLALANQWADAPFGYLDIAEFEGGTGPIGLRIMGRPWVLDYTALNGGSGQTAYIDTHGLVCRSCNTQGGSVVVSGSGNKIELASDPNMGSTITNRGLFNTITSNFSPNPFMGINSGNARNMVPTKANTNGALAADFIRDGNYSTPYSLNDLFFWPQELVINSYGNAGTWEQFVQPDTSSPTGSYFIVHAGGAMYNWAQFAGGAAVIGQNLPAGPATVAFYAKCPSGTTTATFGVGIVNGGYSYQVPWQKTITCSTSYASYSMPVDFTSFPGGNVVFLSQNNPIDAAWIAIRPNQADFNGSQPMLATNIAPTLKVYSGFAPYTFSAANFAQSGTSSQPDSTSPTGYSLTSTALWVNANPIGGVDYPAVQGQWSFTAKAPAVYTSTLNGAITAGATSITLSLATTSAFPANGLLLIDNEIVQYSGTPTAGTTTLTVTRGVGGTAAVAHGSGASVNSAASGTTYITCNSVNVGVISTYFTKNWTTFTGSLDGSQCLGYQTSWSPAFVNQFSGQTYSLAGITITPFAEMPYANAANLVPVSVGSGPSRFNGTKALAGSGASIVTGPSSGVANGHPVCYTGTTGQTQDCGVALPSAPLTGTTGSIGGSSLTAGTCATGAVTISGATTGMVAVATPSTYPGDGMAWRPYVSAANTITVKVCAEVAGTPAASTYNVRVIP